MKRLIIMMALLATSVAAKAQLQAGVKAGLSTANVEIQQLRNDPWQYTKAENVTGYHAGAFARLQVAGLFVQPEAILTSTGGKIEVSGTDNIGVRVENFKFNRLDVPIMIGYNFLNVVRVQAGPVSSTLLSARQEGQDIKQYMENADWGFQAGVGLDIGSITADVRYERINRQLTNTAQQTGMQVNNQQFIFSLGYKLIR
ncbi:porin family protein [Pontibacter toksunensis]|uniref:Porin family protein n=1 Tax=Pontibacter toksunensis TaxID=1332631 RepID=A0ABW6C450_9BACT